MSISSWLVALPTTAENAEQERERNNTHVDTKTQSKFEAARRIGPVGAGRRGRACPCLPAQPHWRVRSPESPQPRVGFGRSSSRERKKSGQN